VGPMAALDGCGKFRLLPGFDPWTVQPLASRYTDCSSLNSALRTLSNASVIGRMRNI
jgi:hypothetical protein